MRGLALAEAFNLSGNAHLTEDLFDHDPAYVRAFSLDIGNAEFPKLPFNRIFDKAGLGAPCRTYMAGAFLELLVRHNNIPFNMPF
jgi:hypothetical protein